VAIGSVSPTRFLARPSCLERLLLVVPAGQEGDGAGASLQDFPSGNVATTILGHLTDFLSPVPDCCAKAIVGTNRLSERAARIDVHCKKQIGHSRNPRGIVRAAAIGANKQRKLIASPRNCLRRRYAEDRRSEGRRVPVPWPRAGPCCIDIQRSKWSASTRLN
jgi:hypothetical protein